MYKGQRVLFLTCAYNEEGKIADVLRRMQTGIADAILMVDDGSTDRTAELGREAGAEVIGVMPRSMVDREIAHPRLTELRIVETMHQRKAQMAELADAFVALPGGLGTLEELFETWSLAQLGMHDKAFGIVNVAGYFDPLRHMVERMVAEGFIPAAQVQRLVTGPDPDTVLEWLARHTS